MKHYDFLYDYKANGKIARGREVVYYPTYENAGDPKIVRLAGYCPYYSDDSPDPTCAEECVDWCMIEVDGDIDDSQVCLEDLYELNEYEGESLLLYQGEKIEVIGTFNVFDDETKYVYKIDDIVKFADEEDLEERRELGDLDDSELKWFYSHCLHGSMYLGDYRNTLGIEVHEASDIADDWWEHIEEDGADKTFKEFKSFFGLDQSHTDSSTIHNFNKLKTKEYG